MILRTIGIYAITSTFFYVFLRFSKSKKSRLFTFFAVFRTFSRTMTLDVSRTVFEILTNKPRKYENTSLLFPPISSSTLPLGGGGYR